MESVPHLKPLESYSEVKSSTDLLRNPCACICTQKIDTDWQTWYAFSQRKEAGPLPLCRMWRKKSMNDIPGPLSGRCFCSRWH